MRALGVRYAEGQGVAADPVEALKWYILAGERGAKDASALARSLRERLPAAQAEEAERRAASWRPGDRS
jgi:TPR repeat protein